MITIPTSLTPHRVLASGARHTWTIGRATAARIALEHVQRHILPVLGEGWTARMGGTLSNMPQEGGPEIVLQFGERYYTAPVCSDDSRWQEGTPFVVRLLEPSNPPVWDLASNAYAGDSPAWGVLVTAFRAVA